MEDQPPKLTKKEKRMLKKEQHMKEESKVAQTTTVRKFLYWGIGLAAVFGLFWYGKSLVAVPSSTSPIPGTTSAVAGDHIKGATESSKLLIEYSDLQCPACAAFYPLVEKLLTDHGNDVTFVYRHFPLTQVHKNAQMSAQCAEAAGRQNKFFEMVDILFTRQKDWEDKSGFDVICKDYAKELELNLEQFNNDLFSDEVKNKIQADYVSGLQAKINQTPTFIFNGTKLEPVKSYEEFAKKLGF